MCKVKAELDDMPIQNGDEVIPEWKMKKDMDAAYKLGQEKLKEEIEIELNFFSESILPEEVTADQINKLIIKIRKYKNNL